MMADFAAVRLLRDDFWRHPERSSDERLFAFLKCVRQLTCDAEVGQLDGASFRQKHVSSWWQNNTPHITYCQINTHTVVTFDNKPEVM